jgi:hypothetical protein
VLDRWRKRLNLWGCIRDIPHLPAKARVDMGHPAFVHPSASLRKERAKSGHSNAGFAHFKEQPTPKQRNTSLRAGRKKP